MVNKKYLTIKSPLIKIRILTITIYAAGQTNKNLIHHYFQAAKQSVAKIYYCYRSPSTITSSSSKVKSARESSCRSACVIWSCLVIGLGTATQYNPARLAAKTPFGESSKAIAWSALTPRHSRAVRYRVGSGLVTPTSSAANTHSK